MVSIIWDVVFSQVKLVNISNNDIVDGNVKLTLGLVWSIISHWQVKEVLKEATTTMDEGQNLEKTVLNWCKESTQGYRNVDVRNFTTSWRDGLAFNALIHRYRPDLFDFNNVSKEQPEARLEHAFRVAHEHLAVERLLDPEDVNMEHPDKKSIVMYMMMLYKALPKQPPVIEEQQPVEESRVPLNLEGAASKASTPLEFGSITPSSEPSLSDMSEIDIESYQGNMENVLTWLLEAEGHLENQEPISGNVDEVKEQFHIHEDFMMELTAHQNSVGNALQEGNYLIIENKVSEEEENEVREQMILLNTRWENLRISAMDRQAKLHEVLMTLQQKQLDDLGEWLAKTEERIATQESLGSDLAQIREQVDEHKRLQEDLETQQMQVNSLTHMVVVVDENSPENTTEVLEEQLTNLGERWANVCQWTEQRWAMLQEVLVHWQTFSQEQVKFDDWLAEKENVLAKMRLQDITNTDEAMERIKQLKSTKD
ncbi:utrophin-like [Amphiura filiformis]|uniref:utrophin-like n=1 Tax=Amphiura filiformis TaxID=82378 RepID=UPI003B2263B0